jgi:hypothetical protein
MLSMGLAHGMGISAFWRLACHAALTGSSPVHRGVKKTAYRVFALTTVAAGVSAIKIINRTA